MADAKNLDYYLANPDEMPDDLTELAKDLEPREAEEDVKAIDESSDVEAKAEEVKVEEAPKAEEPAVEDEKPVLLSKNGKTEIPYQVLVTERERRAAAEKAAQELKDRLAEIEAKVAAVGTQQTQQQEQPDEDAVDFDKYVEDFPEIGKVIKHLQGQIEAANAKLQQVEQIEQSRRLQEVETTRNKVQEAIDGNPTLRYWQNEDMEMFGKAVEFDNMLRGDPRNASLTMEQRFEKVVKAMTAIYGEPELPDAYKPAAAPKTEDMNELTEKAKSVVKETGQFKPRSLSDIPGGTPPAANESEKLQSMSPAQLAAMMQSMDADQINTMLAKLG